MRMADLVNNKLILWLILAVFASSSGTLLAAGNEIPVDSGQENQLLQTVGAEFQIKRTPHFLIVYNTEKKLVIELISRLEHTYHAVYRFCKACGIEGKQPSRRLEVLFFNEPSEYINYTTNFAFPAAGTYGLYFEPTNRSAFFNVLNEPQMILLHIGITTAQENLDQLKKTLKEIRNNQTPVEIRFRNGRTVRLTKTEIKKKIESTESELQILDGRRKAYSDHINQTVMQHETAHQVLFNAGIHVRGSTNPRWLVEGLACLFETPPSSRGAGFATINQMRLKDFRTAVAGESSKQRLTADDYFTAVEKGRIPSLHDLITKPRLLESRGQSGTTAYALAWALTHYLHRNKTEQFAAYLKDLSSRHPTTRVNPSRELAVFEKHFGPIDRDFVKQWSEYIFRLKYRLPKVEW